MMRLDLISPSRLFAVPTLAAVLFAPTALPQGRPVDWPSAGGDARRSGWERSDVRITKDNVKDFQLVLKRKFDGQPTGARALSPPVVIGLLISYKGFKELGFLTSASGEIWSIDVDVDKPFWHKNFGAIARSGSGDCGAPAAITPALTPPLTFPRRPAAAKTASQSPGLPPTPAGRNTALPARLGGGGFGGPRPVYVIANDGKLHQVNTSDGSDQFPPLDFLPKNARPSNLVMTDYTVYAATSGGCNGVPDAIWAIDLSQEEPTISQAALPAGGAGGLHGFAVGNDGTVYVQTAGADSKLLSFTGKQLKPKGSYTPASSSSKGSHSATPVVFEFGGKDLIATAGRDGRISLLDAEQLGGEVTNPIAQSVPLSTSGGVWGGLSTWEDNDGARWVAAPVWGPVNPELKAGNGPAPNGSVVAFRIEDKNGKPALVPGWVSRDLSSPVPPVVTSGIVFALSTGQGARKENAVLYALDGSTGKEMYSTGSQVNAPASLTGLSIANGRVFFTTADSTLYGFGIFLER